MFSEKVRVDDDVNVNFPVVCRSATQPCRFMLPVFSSKGQVSAGTPLFVVNTKKAEKVKESSKTGHGGAVIEANTRDLRGITLL